jgi:hypothetical protein
MAKCSLSFDVDHPLDVPLVPGEALTGHVVVDVDADVRCRKLTVDFGWRTHGSGNRASGNPQRLVLFEGEWQGGELLRYPFRFDVPAGPDTYHGHHLNVDWYLTANADIPWAFDPKAEVDLLMDARSSDRYDHGPQFTSGMNTMGVVGSIAGTMMGVFLIGFSSLFVCVGGFAVSEDGLFGLIFLLMPLIFMGAGFYVIFRAWRSKMAETLLGEVSVEVPDSLSPGETFTALVHIEPVREVTLNALKLTFNGTERVVRGSGTNTTTYTHEVHNETHASAQGRTIAAGEHAIFEQSFTVPADAGASFAAPSNTLIWKLGVHFDIPRFPDWVGDYVVAVRRRG